MKINNQSSLIIRWTLFMTSLLQKICPLCFVLGLSLASFYSPVISMSVDDASASPMPQSACPNSCSAAITYGLRALSLIA